MFDSGCSQRRFARACDDVHYASAVVIQPYSKAFLLPGKETKLHLLALQCFQLKKATNE
jgi:hypothetical protein